AERLERPDKYWKFNPGDIAERALWPEYQQAYQLAIERTSTDAAPWYVIPANHKWYARLAVAELLTDALRSLGQSWPPADFDVEEQQRLLRATGEGRVTGAASPGGRHDGRDSELRRG